VERVKRVRGRWNALWQRVDGAINQCEMMSWGSPGFARAIVLSGQQQTRAAAVPSGTGAE
jgi:hypothetical protein